MDFDVFNGDADGLCALLQLRLEESRDAVLITGVKRDIQLLQRVEAQSGDRVTVLDISMAKNMQALHELLAIGVSVFYVDHHQAGAIPESPSLNACINTDANVCTSLLVDEQLKGRYRAWAVAAAFGDNLRTSAQKAAESLNLTEAQLDELAQLGVCLNYNGYGATEADLLFHPAELFKEMRPFASPFDFMDSNRAVYEQLRTGYEEDIGHARVLKPNHLAESTAVYILPDAAWSRRVSGVFANDLANVDPNRAHAILSANADGSYTVSVRAPLNNKTGADELCQAFPTGGGRKAAAGINKLPEHDVDRFIQKFSAHYAC